MADRPEATEQLWVAARSLHAAMSRIEAIDAELEPARVGAKSMPADRYAGLKQQLSAAEQSANRQVQIIRDLAVSAQSNQSGAGVITDSMVRAALDKLKECIGGAEASEAGIAGASASNWMRQVLEAAVEGPNAK